MHPNVRAAVAAVALGLMFAAAGCASKPAAEGTTATTSTSTDTTLVTGTAGTIHVDDGGTGGMPVVFVHSFAGSSAHWDSVLAHLRTSRRALALDLRGHGASAAPVTNAGWSVDSLASDIGAVADRKGLDRFVLVGHSLGGVASAAYAGQHPDRVAGLVLVGTPGPSKPEMAARVMAQMEANYDSTTQGYWNRLLANATPETRSRIMGEMQSVPRPASLEIMRTIFAYDPMPAIRAYPGPILLIDPAGMDNPQSIHRLDPKLTWRTIAGTSHWPQLDKPREFESMLDAFLGTVGTGAAMTTPAPVDTM